MTHVREGTRFGPCFVLGELIGETATKYIYRNRVGPAFVSNTRHRSMSRRVRCARIIPSARRR
jgi:hypothetical protein